MDHLPVQPSTFLRNWQLKSPHSTTQSLFGTDCSSTSSCSIVSCAKGETFLNLCGIYATMKKIAQTGPCNRTQAIRVPTQPESWTFVAMQGDNMMATPPAGSLYLPSSFSSAIFDVIHSLDGGIIFCLFRSSVKPKTSLPSDSQKACRALLYEQQFQHAKSRLCHLFDHFGLTIVQVNARQSPFTAN